MLTQYVVLLRNNQSKLGFTDVFLIVLVFIGVILLVLFLTEGPLIMIYIPPCI